MEYSKSCFSSLSLSLSLYRTYEIYTNTQNEKKLEKKRATSAAENAYTSTSQNANNNTLSRLCSSLSYHLPYYHNCHAQCFTSVMSFSVWRLESSHAQIASRLMLRSFWAYCCCCSPHPPTWSCRVPHRHRHHRRARVSIRSRH